MDSLLEGGRYSELFNAENTALGRLMNAKSAYDRAA
jgi:hypothetical protein